MREKSTKTVLKRIEPGVYLRTQGDNRFYIFKYQLRGKRRELGLGGTDLTISAVRAKAAKLKALIADGIDPADHLNKIREAKIAEAEAQEKAKAMPTFKAFALDAIPRIKRLRGWTNEKAEQQWYTTLERYVFPTIGNIPVDKLTKRDVLKVLEPIWYEKSDTANKVRGRIHLILDRAKSDELVDRNVADWKGGLDNDLPSIEVMRKGTLTNHYSAVTPTQLKRVARELVTRDAITAKAALFGFLTVGRASEFSQARWSEIDFEDAVFNQPRRKDKKSEYFKIPLCKQAVALLKSIPRTSEFVFPSPYKRNQSICLDSIRLYLKSVTDKEITTHGTRSTFSDWCAQNEKDILVSEKCLMHSFGGKVFRAYQRDDLLSRRRKLMQEWADFLFEEA